MTVRETSREAYALLTNLSDKQRAVYDVIADLGACTDLEIAAALSLPINSITPRRGELVAMGLVTERGHVQQNGRKAITWSLASRVRTRSAPAEAQASLL